MTIELFCTLLLAFGTGTTIVVEFIKKLLDGFKMNYSSSVLALVVGGLVGIGGTAAYFVMASIAFTPQNLVWILFEGICVIMGSQLGYDKIVAIVKQITATKKS